MAKVKITGHASGTGVITVTAPNTSTDRTLTLPDATATIATTTDVAARLPSITDGGNATAITIDSAENVGIGTTAPLRQLHISNTSANPEIAFTSGTSGAASLLFGDGLTGTDVYKGYVQYQHNGDYMLIATGATDRLRVDSDGLKFNADTAAANALNDYEEGTFTVGWQSTNNSFNPSSTTGYYTKVGNLVTVTYNAYLSGAPTIGTAANGFSFTGLPFTSSSGKVSALTWGHKRWMEWPANTTDVFLQIPASSTTVETLARTGIGEMYNIRAQAFSRNGSGVTFAGHYYTDS